MLLKNGINRIVYRYGKEWLRKTLYSLRTLRWVKKL